MPKLSEIILYPIKSCAGISVSQATLTQRGLEAEGVRDREWMLVDDSGRFLTQREYPKMALIQPQLGGDCLRVTAPGMPDLALPLAAPDTVSVAAITVHLWDDAVLAADCGNAVANWFSRVLGAPCRLVRFHPDAARFASAKWTGGIAAPTLFSDGYPVLVAGSASLDDLNQKLVAAGRGALPMNRFRPNLVIDGIEAFEEDYADYFQLGQSRLKPVKPCPRCPIPSVDQGSGVPGPDPLDILQTYRRKPILDDAVCFGMNCIVIEGGEQTLHAGQEVDVVLAF
jgi:uncharacterized protein YcbX